MQTLCVFWTNHQHMDKHAGQEKQQAVGKKIMRKMEEKRKLVSKVGSAQRADTLL